MKRIILVCAAFAMFLALGCTKREDLVVVRIGDRHITVVDVENSSEVMEEKYLPLTKDLEGKRELLKHIINKEIMALKARSAGYEKEEWFVKFWEKFRNPFLVAALMDQEIRKKVVVSDEEVEEYYQQMHYEYTLSQLLLSDEDFAWQLRQRILDGEGFAELAKKYSLGPGADDGGYIGSNVVGRILYWVEEELFDMEADDISEPLRTTTGYALIKLHSKRKIVPDLDREYARNRVKAIKEKKGIMEYKARIEKDIGLKFVPKAVDIAYSLLPEDTPFEDIVSYKVTRSNAPGVELPAEYEDMIICQYNDGMYTLKDFAELYGLMGLPARPRRAWGKESIVQVLHKMVFDKVLPVYAEHKAKVLENPEVSEVLDQRMEQFLVHRLYQDQVRDEMGVTDREVETYFQEHMNEFMTQERRDFTIILVEDMTTAEQVVKMARSGADFEKLAMKFSKDPSVRENMGKTGLAMKGKYPEYDEVAFSLPSEGDVSDPIETARGWAVLEVDKIEKARVPTFAETKQAIKQQLSEEEAERVLHDKLEQWRGGYVIEINEDNLKKVELKRIRQ